MRALILTTAACAAALALTGCNQSAASEDAPAADAVEKAAPEKVAPASDVAKPPAATDASADAAAPAPGKTASAPPPPPSGQAYTPIAVLREDNPGRARQIRCQVGSGRETDCTFTPLFGDGSFQLDGPDIALRMIITEGEGSLFAVISPEERVPIGSFYRRDSRDRACWVQVEPTSAPSRVCAR